MNPSLDIDEEYTQALPSSVRLGGVIAGKYRVERIRGAGGMGIVVEALHLLLNQRIAIKFMSPLLRDNHRGVERFILEARATAHIRCEHVVRVFDVALLEDGTPYIVMEYLEGEDLGELLQRRGRLTPTEAVDYVLQACAAVAHAHAEGIVHRDLKPSNLFCCARPYPFTSPQLKVLDFGASKLLPIADGTLRMGATTGRHVVIGSPLYSSPEQLRGSSDVDGRADIWALGAILYELLAGRSPFAADSFLEVCSRVVYDPVEPLSSLPREMNAAIARCLAKDRNQRFATVAELAEALAPYAPRRTVVSHETVRNPKRTLRMAPPARPAAGASGKRATARRTTPRRTPRVAAVACMAVMATVAMGAAWSCAASKAVAPEAASPVTISQ
jgi:serine/threonine protein kinase